MKLSITREFKPPTWPRYLVQEGPPPLTLSLGVLNIDVGRLEPEQVEELCDDFRAHCKSRREKLSAGEVNR